MVFFNKQLEQMIKSGSLPPALLFVGPKSSGKLADVRALALALFGEAHRRKIELGSHPDIHHYLVEGKSALHSMESISQLIEEVSLPPFEAPWSLYIIEEAERMLPSSSNALLKTLEEPPSQRLFILLTSQPDALLPTLVSRCRTLTFESGEETQTGHEALIDLLTESNPTLLLKKLSAFTSDENDTSTMQEGEAIIGQVVSWYRDLHLLSCNGPSALLTSRGALSQLQERMRRRSLPSLEKVIELGEECRRALAHHIKLRTVLQHFLIHLNEV
jgi:DNA polymerase III delta prime subunit